MMTTGERQSHYLLLPNGESVTCGVARLSEWRADVHSLSTRDATEELTMELSHIEAPLYPAQASVLGLNALRLIELSENVESKAMSDALLVKDLVNEYKRQTGSDLSDVEIAGMITAELAHWGVKRQNGMDYYTHVSATAMILKSTIEQHSKTIQTDPERFQRMLFVAYAHDSFEDILPRNGATYVRSQTIIPSMKFVAKLFALLGRTDGELAADMVLRISKTRQAGLKITQDSYEEGILNDLDTMLVKLSDNVHNDRLDPRGKTEVNPVRRRKNYDRTHEYTAFRARVLARIKEAALQEQLVAHHIANVEVKHLSRAVRMRTPNRPKDTIHTQLANAQI